MTFAPWEARSGEPGLPACFAFALAEARARGPVTNSSSHARAAEPNSERKRANESTISTPSPLRRAMDVEHWSFNKERPASWRCM